MNFRSMSSVGDEKSSGVQSQSRVETNLNNSSVVGEIKGTLGLRCESFVVDRVLKSCEQNGDDLSRTCIDVQAQGHDSLTCEASDGCGASDGESHSFQFQHAQVLGACSVGVFVMIGCKREQFFLCR